MFITVKVLQVKPRMCAGCYQFTLGEHAVFVSSDQVVYDPERQFFIETNVLVANKSRVITLSEAYQYRFLRQFGELATLYEIFVEQPYTYFVSEAFLLAHGA